MRHIRRPGAAATPGPCGRADPVRPTTRRGWHSDPARSAPTRRPPSGRRRTGPCRSTTRSARRRRSRPPSTPSTSTTSTAPAAGPGRDRADLPTGVPARVDGNEIYSGSLATAPSNVLPLGGAEYGEAVAERLVEQAHPGGPLYQVLRLGKHCPDHAVAHRRPSGPPLRRHRLELERSMKPCRGIVWSARSTVSRSQAIGRRRAGKVCPSRTLVRAISVVCGRRSADVSVRGVGAPDNTRASFHDRFAASRSRRRDPGPWNGAFCAASPRGRSFPPSTAAMRRWKE